MSKWFAKIGYAMLIAGGACTTLGAPAPVGVALMAVGGILNHLSDSPIATK